MSKLDDWRAKRARLDVVKTVTYERVNYSKTYHPGTPDEREVQVVKNDGLPASGRVTFLNDGRCPCNGKCGHQYMYECEEADCKCCTSVCN